jgi:hypothetical protein
MSKKFWIAPDDSVIDFEPHGSNHDWKPCSAAEARRARMRYARRKLAALLKPDDTVYPLCTSSSGMSHRFRVFLSVTTPAGRPAIGEVTDWVAHACGFSLRRTGGICEIVMGGCGYSKSFQIVYDLGCALWPEGTPEPHGMRNGEPDSSGGYALTDGRL